MESNFQADKKTILVCSDMVLLKVVTRGGSHFLHNYYVPRVDTCTFFHHHHTAYKTYLQAQQDALNKQHQAEKETAKTEIFELSQCLEEVYACALSFIMNDKHVSHRCVRVFVQSNTPGRRSSSLML